jgi:release factor glutamine methyltransferase
VILVPESQPQDEAWTVSRLLAWTREHLERCEVESPRLCAEILLAHAMGCERIKLFTQFESAPERNVLERFRELVRQAAAGRPIAYLTGTKEFFSLTFEVTPDVLIPRPETEVLVERAIHLVRESAGSVQSLVDLGTGSGCIAISLAKHLPEAVISASDVSEAALQVARRNANRHGVAERIDFRVGDLFTPWPASERFDAILCNPPYVATSESDALPATVRDFEPHAALFAGADGLSVMRRLIGEAPGRLRAGGHLLLEVAYNQASAVRGLLDESGWHAIVAYRDILDHERVVHARRLETTTAKTSA